MIWIKKDKIKQLYWIEIVEFKEQGLNNNNNNLVNKFKVSEPYNDLSLIMITCFLNCLIWSSLNNFSAQEFKSKFKMDFYSWPRFDYCWLFLCTTYLRKLLTNWYPFKRQVSPPTINEHTTLNQDLFIKTTLFIFLKVLFFVSCENFLFLFLAKYD